MVIDRNFSFSLSVSQQQFPSKPSSQQVKIITFAQQDVTVDSTLQYALQGRAFCYDFATSDPDGLITLKEKTEANFTSTSTILFDFDDMDVSMPNFINSLQAKPTFGYPTYSDGKEGHYRFRLGFVFDQPIVGVPSFNSLCQAIATANAFIPEIKGKQGGWDRRNVSQMYYGTTTQAQTYSGYYIYSVGDFGQYSYYSRNDPEVSIDIAPDSAKYKTTFDPEFLHDFFHLPQKSFYVKYRDIFAPNYEPSLETPLILDESGMFFRYPDKYYCVLHKRRSKYTLKHEPGDDRKKRIYVTAQIMHHNLPSMSIENLLFNLCVELHWYYDNPDGKITKEVLVQTAINAYNKPFNLSPLKHGNFRLNKPFWMERGKTSHQAKMIVRGVLKAKQVERLYNPSLTKKENVRILNDNGVKISDKTLSRMVSKADIKINSPKGSHTYLSCCLDSDTILILRLIDKNGNIKQSEIAAALKVSLPTIKRYIAAMKEEYIVREGNNRKGRWILTPKAKQALKSQK